MTVYVAVRAVAIAGAVGRRMAVVLIAAAAVGVGGREGEAGGRALGAEEGLVARPDLEGRRAHKRQSEGVGAVGRGDSALARHPLALQDDLAGTRDLVAQGAELRGEFLVVRQGDEAVVH